ncbi:MAG: insulinase family protein, partial [Candidatus Eiseniibacteriota bacterium]
MSAERETQSCARTVARRFIPVLLLMATVGADARRVAADELSRLEPGAVLHDFEVEALYTNTNTNANANSSGNAADRPLGARLVHRPSRFVVDLLRIQSLPQAFLWVNTPAVSDGGEAHTLEHLLLGKGNKARAVAALETMSLASHSAMTQPARTCYHFHTAAGADAFFALFEARLDAMLAPDFTDEEIRREVCNMGVAVEPESGTLAVEERGTVYTEMVSAYERLPTRLYRQLGVVLYGDGHPLALDSGGLPAAIRALEPDDIRRYHETYYHLGNMGAVVALPGDVSVERCLGELSAILARLGAAAAPDGPAAGGDPATFEERLPAPAGAGGGGLHTVRFPDSDPAAPGRIALAWSPRDVQPLGEELLLEIFVDLVASGSTSNLYARLIDSQTRVVDTGARQLYGWVSDQLGRPVQIQLVDVDAERCNAATVDSVRAVIHREITSISRLRSGTPAMEDFNTRARDRVEELRRALIDFLDSPPRFGFRNTDSAWIDHLQRLDGEGGGRRDLSLSAELERIEQMLAGSRNLWRPRIRAWGLLSIVPEAVVATADPALIEEEVTARQQRLDAFVASLLDRYQVDDRQAAISRYAAEVERGTAVLDSMAAAVGMPPFVDSPPLGLDEMLDFEVLALPGGGPLVASRFDNLSTATTGLVLDLRVLDPSQWLFVPALPALLTEVGVLVDGRPLAYNAFRETLRREILELDVELDVDHATGQAELVLRAAGTDSAESHRAIEWLATVLRTPDLRVENLPRIRDAIDEALGRSRGRMRHREESWVQETARGYRSQGHPLLLHAGCFLTQTYDLHRLGWLLQEGGAVAPRVA